VTTTNCMVGRRNKQKLYELPNDRTVKLKDFEMFKNIPSGLSMHQCSTEKWPLFEMRPESYRMRPRF